MRVAALASDCYLRARKLAVGPGVQVLSPAAGSSHHWSSCRAVIALGMNRFADALFAATETKLTPERLIAEAAKGTRLDAKPFSDPHLVEALGALTSSLREEASLSPLGRLATRWDLKRILSTLLILADTEREDHGILTRPLAPPIFITGLPRSGTTFLHGLLAEDPLNRAPRIWEAIYPHPEHRAAEFGAGRMKVELQLRIFNRLSPGIRNLHPIEADAPEECIELIGGRLAAGRPTTGRTECGGWSKSRTIRPFRCAPDWFTCNIARSSPIQSERLHKFTTRSASSSSQAAREAMSAKVAEVPNGGYGANRYRPEEFGIDPERERERASVYIERFDIAS
jgi:Sulfotransferase family